MQKKQEIVNLYKNNRNYYQLLLRTLGMGITILCNKTQIKCPI